MRLILIIFFLGKSCLRSSLPMRVQSIFYIAVVHCTQISASQAKKNMTEVSPYIRSESPTVSFPSCPRVLPPVPQRVIYGKLYNI